MFWLGFAVGVVLGSIAGLLFAAMCAIGRIEELENELDRIEWEYRARWRVIE